MQREEEEHASGLLPLSAILRIDQACDEFEESCRSGSLPRIEPFLETASEGERGELLRQLLWLEIEYRRRHGAAPTLVEYRARFHEHTAVVDRVFGEADDPAADAAGPSMFRGRYQILRPHAQGGLGRVSIALDREVGRVVALKEIRPHLVHDQAAKARFVFEAKVTGRLEHPGIVAVYGLGQDGEQSPYYAMRLISGRSLREEIQAFHAAQQGWTEYSRQLRKLLRHFIGACQAVEFAHSRGVLHRDLKPANVMLGEHGETFVVDWGLAKLLPGHSLHDDAVQTELFSASPDAQHATHGAIGTPPYMSPEQASQQQNLGPHTDVYGLGATLFSLLTGKLPVADEDIQKVLQRVRSGDVPRPRRFDPRIPRPLEAICRKAMSVDPAGRYAAPRELAEDVEHWLSDEPVLAYRGSWLERGGRWLRRHRRWAAAIAVALVLVACVSTIAAVLVRQSWSQERSARELANQQRSEALRRYRDSRRYLDTWLTGASEALAAFSELQELRVKLLKRAAQDYAQLAVERSEDPELALEACRALIRVGDVQRELEDVATAEQTYRQAEQMLRDLQRNQSGAALAELDGGEVQAKLAAILAETNRPEAAADAYAVATGLLRGWRKKHPEDVAGRDALASTLLHQGDFLRRLGRTAAAKASIQEAAREFLQAAAGAETKDRFLIGAAHAQQLLGSTLCDEGGFDQALVVQRRALVTLDKLLADDPNHPDGLEAHAEAQVAQAAVLGNLGRTVEQIASLRSAQGEFRLLREAFPHVRRHLENCAINGVDLGIALQESGSARDAESELRGILPVLELLVATCPGVSRYCESLATGLQCLGDTLSDLDRHPEAEAPLADAVRQFQVLADQTPAARTRERLAIAKSHWGRLLGQLGKPDAAARELLAAAGMFDDLIAADPDVPRFQNALAHVYQHLAWLYRQTGELARAAEYFEQVHACSQRLVQQSANPVYANRFATFLSDWPDRRPEDIQLALRLIRSAQAADPANPALRSTLASVYYRAGDYASCVDLLGESAPPAANASARDWFILAMALHRQEERARAGPLKDEERANETSPDTSPQRERGNESPPPTASRGGDNAHRQRCQQAYQRGCEWLQANQPGNEEMERLRREAAAVLGLETKPGSSEPPAADASRPQS